MKILVNAVSAKLGGAANYITNLGQELAAMKGSDEFLFLVPGEQAIKIAGLAPNIRVEPTEVGYQSIQQRLRFEQFELRKILRRESIDVLFSTANMGMIAPPCAQVLLVRNALHFDQLYLRHMLPHQGWRARLDDVARRRLICWSVRNASVVMTPSQAMLDSLCRYVVPRKSVVNPYGTMLEKFRNATSPLPAPGGTVRLLHISHYADHKNIGVMLQALQQLAAEASTPVTLTMTANVDDPRYMHSWCRAKDRSLLNEPSVAARVRPLGDTPHSELPAIYKMHDIFVFPSLVESYGHPLVEAMASGLPLVVADTAVAREICQDAALYFDPFSSRDAAAQIRRLIDDESLRREQRERSLRRSESMAWRSHVVRLLQVFREAVLERVQ